MNDEKVSKWWSKPLLRSRPLKAGDRVAVVTPCWGGPAAFPHIYEAGKNQLETLFELELVEMPSALRQPDWIDQNPAARADDLMQAFSDPSISGIIASIGGDDAIRLIPYLDLAVIRDNPKAFIGYSDPTALHFACLKAGVRSFHGPTLMSGFAENGGMSPLTRRSFRRAVFETSPIGVLETATEGWAIEHSDWSDPENQQRPRQRKPSEGLRLLRGRGSATGHLLGGCAEVLEMLKGTPWWPPLDYWENAILFYETSEEKPSETLVLRWMRNFASQGILSRISGILLGRPGGQMSDAQKKAQEAALLRALDEVGLHDLPVITDIDIGHTDPILTIPYGAVATLNCEPASVTILEAGVHLES